MQNVRRRFAAKTAVVIRPPSDRGLPRLEHPACRNLELGTCDQESSARCSPNELATPRDRNPNVNANTSASVNRGTRSQLPIYDEFALPDELIQTRFGGGTTPRFVDISTMGAAGRLPVDEYAESHGTSRLSSTHHKMTIPGVKTKNDPPIYWLSTIGCPFTVQSPDNGHSFILDCTGTL